MQDTLLLMGLTEEYHKAQVWVAESMTLDQVELTGYVFHMSPCLGITCLLASLHRLEAISRKVH